MMDKQKYPEENLIEIHPSEGDTFKVVFGRGCVGWHLIAHAGNRFVQFRSPNMTHPITVTTQIEELEDIPKYENNWLINPINIRSYKKGRRK